MSDSIAVSKSSVTKSVIEKCVQVYSEVLLSVYESKVKKEKRKAALEDDNWRYSVLPTELRDHQQDEGLSKETLARLVQWKITHGVHRPFLPGMIQKNDPKDVLEHTSNARKLLSKSKALHSRESIKTALDAVCKLKGVGPATGTLVLSVFDFAGVPFFQDELFLWLLPNHGAKLKYDVKEYMQLFEAAGDVMNRINVPAWQLEQAAFVLKHLDGLDAEKQAWLLEQDTNHAKEKQQEEDKGKTQPRQELKASEASRDVKSTAKATSKTKARKIEEKLDEDAAANLRSKRIKRH